jgi:periplasmic protein TonB
MYFRVVREGRRPLLEKPQISGRGRWNASLVASVAIHGIVLLGLAIRLEPIFVKPSLVARGDQGTAIRIYLPSQESPETRTAPLLPPPTKEALLTVPLPQPTHPKTDPSPDPPKNQIADQLAGSTLAGSPYGSDYGSLNGDDVRPALPLPTAFKDPHVSRSELPPGVQGDVVVEITIDAEGNVVETKLLQAIGYGIDQKVMAALQEWRFTPATRNGVAIPSKHDVHYHFPG